MKIIWAKHGEERQQQWQQKRPDITREAVETVLSYPEQIVPENDVLVAQSKFGTGLLRIVFIELGNSKRIITLYWGSYRIRVKTCKIGLKALLRGALRKRYRLI